MIREELAVYYCEAPRCIFTWHTIFDVITKKMITPAGHYCVNGEWVPWQ